MGLLQKLKKLVPDQHPMRLLWHKSKAFVAAFYYGFPAKKLTVIGVTGTDGKTTTVGMIAHILYDNGYVVGALSTAFFRVKDRIEWNATQKTSPSPFIIQKFLKRLVRTGCTHAVLEYSSHGLTQGRTLYTWPSIAAITNISEEHLDYHGTMQEYIHAKSLLFRMIKKEGTKILNAADKTFDMYKNIPTKRTIRYASNHKPDPSSNSNDSVLHATDVHSYAIGAEAKLRVSVYQKPDENYRIALPIPGAFNIDNALCAISCAHAAGVPIDESIKSLSTFKGIPGRMESIKEGQDFYVFIDFTVTPQSYEKTLSTLKASLIPGKRLLVLTGSCGDRMKEKRPTIGKIVSRYANVMVVANEDPYTENPEKIIDEVWTGIDQHKTDAHRIFDRKEAIEFLLKEAKKDDIVILCGKGSDTTMWVKTGKIPWDERTITREILKTLRH